MTREGGRAEHPREGGKRKEGKEAEDLCDRTASEKVPLEQRPKKGGSHKGRVFQAKERQCAQSRGSC